MRAAGLLGGCLLVNGGELMTLCGAVPDVSGGRDKLYDDDDILGYVCGGNADLLSS